MLSDQNFRHDVIAQIISPQLRNYWQHMDPRFIKEGLPALRNKLHEMVHSPAIHAVLTSNPNRQPLDLFDIIQGRKVLIANLDQTKLGKTGVRLLGIFLITLVWHAIASQTVVPKADRVPTALVIDEAQHFISQGFLDILAEGPAYNLQITPAVRFLEKILSHRGTSDIHTLAQNLIVFQSALQDDVKNLMHELIRPASAVLNPSENAQPALNFAVDDLMRLPTHHAVCRWLADGSPQPAFLAETML